MKIYKVWIEIEEYNEETGRGLLRSVELLDFASTGDFATEADAVGFAESLHRFGLESGADYHAIEDDPDPKALSQPDKSVRAPESEIRREV